MTASKLTSKASAQTLTVAAAGDGALVSSGAVTLSPPRNLVIVLSSHSDWDATTAVVTGTDIDGNVMTENFSIPNGGNTTVTGAKAFATVTSLYIPAQTGTGGTGTFGTGTLIGLGRPIAAKGGVAAVICEKNAGTLVVTGTIQLPAVGAPNGTYVADTTVPDGSRDYALCYAVASTGALGQFKLLAESVESGQYVDIQHQIAGVAADPPAGTRLFIGLTLKNSRVV